MTGNKNKERPEKRGEEKSGEEKRRQELGVKEQEWEGREKGWKKSRREDKIECNAGCQTQASPILSMYSSPLS